MVDISESETLEKEICVYRKTQHDKLSQWALGLLALIGIGSAVGKAFIWGFGRQLRQGQKRTGI